MIPGSGSIPEDFSMARLETFDRMSSGSLVPLARRLTAIGRRVDQRDIRGRPDRSWSQNRPDRAASRVGALVLALLSPLGAPAQIAAKQQTVVFEDTKIFAAEGMAEDRFGWAVAVSGDTAVVGTNPDLEGFAYIYQRDPTDETVWNQVTQLVPSEVITSGPASARFGTAVAIDGDTVIVGAGNDSSIDQFSGAVFVFERDLGGPDNWGEVKKILADDGGFQHLFGRVVALDGDRLAVGAEGVPPLGAAYVFERDVGGEENWGFVESVVPPDDGEPFFGRTVDIDGDVLVVGRETDDEFGVNAGAVYLFERNLTGPDQWGLRKKIVADDAQALTNFGTGLAVAGELLVVGADQGGTALSPRTGSVYVFSRDQGGPDQWGQVTELLASDGQTEDLFGRNVAVNSSYISVTTEANAAYVFASADGAWQEQFKLMGENAVFEDFFGRDLDMSGATVIVGTINDDENGQDAGAAYFFSLFNDSLFRDRFEREN
jgi:hypothetical protein